MFLNRELVITSMSVLKKGSAKKEADKFMNIKVPVFINKNNGQISVSIPKTKFKKSDKDKLKAIPKELPIKIKKWW